MYGHKSRWAGIDTLCWGFQGKKFVEIVLLGGGQSFMTPKLLFPGCN